MAKTKFKGNPIGTSGELPKVGDKAPDFLLTKTDLTDVTLEHFKGKTVVFNIFPSVDTPVCATSVRKFNSEINNYENAVVLCASRDLPFALDRFCGAEGLDNVIPVSELRSLEFGNDYGVRIVDQPLEGLLARAIVIIDPDGKVIYSQLAPEVAREPDYEDALSVLKKK